MPSINLNNISEPQTLTDGYTNKPLSFIEWTKRNTGISFSDGQNQYKQYVNDFYKEVSKKNEITSSALKNDYTNLILQLGIIFKDDVEFERYKNIDVTSSTDLTIAIPEYAKKLKEIALFYAKKRNELKDKKLEYNLVGSTEGLTKILYNKLVSTFTKNNVSTFINDNPLISTSPILSAIQKEMTIEIEELYDTVDYYESSSHLNPFACALNALCYTSTNIPVSAKADPLEYSYICNPSNETVEGLLQEAYVKYIGTDRYYISGGFYNEKYIDVTMPIFQGDNFFYWFSGKTVFDIPEGEYGDLNIHDISWANASGGATIDESDIIFVNAGNNYTKGAWLQKTEYTTIDATMSATINDGKIFKFPYSYMGTSAYGGDWSGPGIDDTVKLGRSAKSFFPTEEAFDNNKVAVSDLYWNTFSTISTVNPINIQELTLGKSSGYASNNYNNADKIIIFKDNDSGRRVYNESNTTSWLYDFRQTQFPISVGYNNILFPIQTYKDATELFFQYDVGNPVALSSLKVGDCFAGAIAGETILESDVIIKNYSICGPEIEAAWLKAVPLKLFTGKDKLECLCDEQRITHFTDWKFTKGGFQSSLAFVCKPGSQIRFTWTGNNTDINKIKGFTGFEHDDSCPYKHMDHSVSTVDKNFLDDTNKDLFEKWKHCTCHAIYHSPFGHNIADIEYYNIIPDFIVKDNTYPSEFNRKTWTDSDGNDYTSSSESARFYPNIIEKDVGWGAGEWKNQKNGSFVLEKGVSYIYYRASVNLCSFESPYFIINSVYDDDGTNNVQSDACETISFVPQWIKAIKNVNDEWEDTGLVSDMILNFGDFLVYDHKESYIEQKSKMYYNGVDISSLSGSNITLDVNDPAVSYSTYTREVAAINFIIKIPITGNLPYWATKYDNTSRIVNEYLHITQPEPLNFVLENEDVIEYKFGLCDSKCFIWEQPLTFLVYDPIFRWNEILTDNCVKSDILDYINSEISNCKTQTIRCLSDCSDSIKCGCEHYCTTAKKGVTATSNPSDIIFNTEIRGIPLLVNYYALKEFRPVFTIRDLTYGEFPIYTPVVSGLYISAERPWAKLISPDSADFVVEENITNLKTEKELNFYMPRRIGMNRYETYDSSNTVSANNITTQLIGIDNSFEYPLIKTSSNSEYVTEYSHGKRHGNITGDHQTFYPYTNTNERYGKEYYGLYNNDISFTPWNDSSIKWSENDILVDYKNIIDKDCLATWSSLQYNLSGDVWKWETDIYNNQYFLIFAEAIDFSETPITYGTGYLKNSIGTVIPFNIGLSAIFNRYLNISFGTTPTTSAENIYLTTEDGFYLTLESGQFIVI